MDRVLFNVLVVIPLLHGTACPPSLCLPRFSYNVRKDPLRSSLLTRASLEWITVFVFFFCLVFSLSVFFVSFGCVLRILRIRRDRV